MKRRLLQCAAVLSSALWLAGVAGLFWARPGQACWVDNAVLAIYTGLLQLWALIETFVDREPGNS